MPEQVRRASTLFSVTEMAQLRAVRDLVDANLWGDTPHAAAVTYQRPPRPSQPVLVWREGQSEPVVEWL